MKKGALLILLLAGILSLSLTKKEGEQYIRWDSNRPLIWNDFQGKLDANIVLQNPVQGDQIIEEADRKTIIHTEMDAYCYHQINFMARYYGDTVTYEVKTLFDKSKSWTNSTSAYILNHEQRHFDIGEVHARRFRKFLADSMNAYDAARQKLVFNRFINDNLEAQKEYDSITNHSINVDQQLRYNQEIDSLLNAYSAYSEIQVKKYSPQKKSRK